jgi:hypothetical protein
MQEPDYFRSIIVISSIWKEVGWGTIIYLAAIAGINPDLYEAAEVDGAGKWRQTISITIPSILPTIMVMLNAGRFYLRQLQGGHGGSDDDFPSSDDPFVSASQIARHAEYDLIGYRTGTHQRIQYGYYDLFLPQHSCRSAGFGQN